MSRKRCERYQKSQLAFALEKVFIYFFRCRVCQRWQYILSETNSLREHLKLDIYELPKLNAFEEKLVRGLLNERTAIPDLKSRLAKAMHHLINWEVKYFHVTQEFAPRFTRSILMISNSRYLLHVDVFDDIMPDVKTPVKLLLEPLGFKDFKRSNVENDDLWECRCGMLRSEICVLPTTIKTADE